MLVVRAMQLLLQLMGFGLTADGIMGAATQAAVEKALASGDPLAEGVRRLYARFPSQAKSISIEEAAVLCARISASEGVPFSYLWQTLMVENYQKNGAFLLDTTPPFVGLGQFNESTWTSIMDEPFSAAADPELSVMAIAKLYKANKRTNDRTVKKDFTDDVAYLYHNQGAPSAIQFLKTGVLRYPKQSAHALQIFERIA